MEILGIDLGNSLVRICVLSCGCCTLPVVVLVLINRAVGGRLSVLPVIWAIIPVAAAQVVGLFSGMFNRVSGERDPDEVAEERVQRASINLRSRMEAANQSFEAQIGAQPTNQGYQAGGGGHDPLDPGQFSSQQAPPPQFRNQPGRPIQRRDNQQLTGGGQGQGGHPPQQGGRPPQQGGDPRFRGGVDPLAGPPPRNPNQPQQGGPRRPQRRPGQGGQRPPQQGGQRPPQQGGQRPPQQGGDPRFRGGVDPLAGPPPQNPPMRTPYERRSDDPWETADDIRSPRGDDLFGPASLPGLAGRDFSSEEPPRRNPKRDTRRREHNDDEIFGGYFDEDGDGFSDY